MSKNFNKYQEVTLGNLIKRIVHDPIYRSRWSVVFALIWTLFNFSFYLALGIIDTIKDTTFSWNYGLSFWYLTFLVFKIFLIVNLFKRIKHKKWVDFKLLSAIFLFISFAEITFVAFVPSFFETVFQSKINKPLAIVQIVINSINILLFFLSFWPVKRKNFTKNEADFLIFKHYVTRMGGMFNWLIIIINLLFTYGVIYTHAWVVGIIYFVVCMAFSIMCLVLAIRALVKRRWDLAHKQANLKHAKANKK